MMKNKFRNINTWIYILANFLNGFYFNLIGSITLTELFVLTKIPHIFSLITKSNIPELKKIATLYSLLLIVQIIAEICVGNTFINALKGIMVTVMSFLLFVFYFELLVKDISVVKWTPLITIVSLIIFGDQFGFAETGKVTFFKFYVAPILINLVLFIILIGGRYLKKYIVLISGVVSLFIIAGGARSLGFSMLFATIAYIIYYQYKIISWKRITSGIIVAFLIFQIFYAYVYVPKVVSGEWGSEQNREQLSTVGNSKNALMIIMAARADFFVAWQAFMDKPLWGYGSWTKDKTHKYHNMLLHLQKADNRTGAIDNDNLIPAHSVVVGMGTQHGFFEFIIFLILFIYMYKLGFKALNKRISKGYNYYLIYLLICSFQNLMFGPPAVLKITGSIAFAVFAAFYLLKKNMQKKITVSKLIHN